MTTGEALKLIRERNWLDATRFAARLGVDRETVTRAENRDRVSPALDAAVRRVFWFSPRLLADPASCDDPTEREWHLTYLRPLGALP